MMLFKFALLLRATAFVVPTVTRGPIIAKGTAKELDEFPVTGPGVTGLVEVRRDKPEDRMVVLPDLQMVWNLRGEWVSMIMKAATSNVATIVVALVCFFLHLPIAGLIIISLKMLRWRWEYHKFSSTISEDPLLAFGVVLVLSFLVPVAVALGAVTLLALPSILPLIPHPMYPFLMSIPFSSDPLAWFLAMLRLAIVSITRFPH